ncbi:MAG: hypothetical protein FJX29_10280 [Alphaproteobacteria bacterium]|nr:hypothetical protein [Alphaproteobacteria bacterium]
MPAYALRATLVAAITAASSLGATRASAQDETAFYKGRQVIMLIAATAGGGYDRWARTVSRHIGKHIPGNPSIVNQNMGAAGGISGTAHIYNVLVRDGSAIGMITRDAPLAPIMHPGKIPFDPVKLNWLGSTTTETSICVARIGAPVQSLEDLRAREFIVGDTGAGTGTYVFPRALAGIFGLKFKPVSGFQNSVDVMLAVERREVDGICESLDSVEQKYPGWLAKKSLAPIIQGGAQPHPSLKGVPYVMDLAKTEDDRKALRFLYAGQGIGRPFVAPPGVPEARLKVLRAAFAATMKDPEFLAEAKKLRLRVEPVSAEALTALVKELNETPREVIQRVAKFMGR